MGLTFVAGDAAWCLLQGHITQLSELVCLGGQPGPGRIKSVPAGLIHPQEGFRADVGAPWTALLVPILPPRSSLQGSPLPQAASLFGATLRNQKNSSFHAIKTCIPSFGQSRLHCSSSEFSDLAVQFAKKSASLEKSSYH